MEITYDPAKDTTNLARHGVSLALAARLDLDTAVIWPDLRNEYGEPSQSALALPGSRVYFTAFVDRTDGRRIISLRKANNREKARYAKVYDAS